MNCEEKKIASSTQSDFSMIQNWNKASLKLQRLRKDTLSGFAFTGSRETSAQRITEADAVMRTVHLVVFAERRKVYNTLRGKSYEVPGLLQNECIMCF